MNTSKTRSIVSFYEYNEDERIALTEQTMREKRTLYERWVGLPNSEAEPWNARAAAAMELLDDQHGIADLGCGTMNLERHLTPGIVYYPVDVVARDERTIICDFNHEPPPRTPASAAVCLGILEYLFDVPSFMHELAKRYSVCVISYNPSNGSTLNEQRARRSHAWVNDYDRDGLEFIFARCWRIETCKRVDDAQLLWRLGR